MGIFAPTPFEEIPDAEWMRFFETNVMSGVRLSRHYLAGMRARGWGRIVFVSSESAVQIPAEMIHYGMTKTAQVAVARGLAETTAGTAITVNTVLAGPTWSEGVGTFMDRLAEARHVDAATLEREFFETGPGDLLIAGMRETRSYAAFLRHRIAPGSGRRVDKYLREVVFASLVHADSDPGELVVADDVLQVRRAAEPVLDRDLGRIGVAPVVGDVLSNSGI